MDATLVAMGYRGEDASRTRADSRRQPPWQSSGTEPAATASTSWTDGSRGYGQDDAYAPADEYGGYDAYDDYAQDDSYAGHEEYGQHGGYGQQAGYDTAGGYGPDGYVPDGYGRAQGNGYPHGAGHPAGYGSSAGQPALPSGYDRSGGYPAQPGGYGQPEGYGQPGGLPALPADHDTSGGYPAQPAGDHADVPGRYAGNDWYGQPGAASGSGFADTGTYNLDARTIDSYGTGPRPAGASGYSHDEYEQDGYDDYQAGAQTQLAMRDPVRGFPPGRTGQPALETGAPQGLVHTGQQERYDDQYEPYPGYEDRQEGYEDARGYGAPQGYDEPDAFGMRGYDAGPGYDSRDADHVQDGYDDYGDPYQDRYGDDGTAPRPVGKGGKTAKKGGGRLGKRPLLLSALAVVVVGILAAAGYVFVLKPKPPAENSMASNGPLPSPGTKSAATAACVKQFGEYCHIELRADDPAPLTLAELFPPAFLNETNHASFGRVGMRLDKKCADAVIGPDLVKALQDGQCTQVLRASYVSGDNKIMGTIGVVNLSTTNQAHKAGKLVGTNNFVTPLSSSKGIASKLGKGTGVVEAEFKGHYLILIWAEFATTNKPANDAQVKQLQQWGNDLVAGTANISLSQRMVNGTPATAAAG